MIIEVDSYFKNEDIQTYVDFIYTSIQKGGHAAEYQWSILNEMSLESAKTRTIRIGNYTEQVFSPLVYDAAEVKGEGASLYRRSVCNTIAGWEGKSEEFTEQEVQQIFETVHYLYKIHNEKTIDSSKIFFGKISTVSKIYHFSNPWYWAFYDPHISSVLDKFAQDFQKADADAAERLGDVIRFPVPDTSEGRLNPDSSWNNTVASIKFVHASLLLRSIVKTLNANRVFGGNLISNQKTWTISHAEMALTALSLYTEHKVRDPRGPDEPTIDWKGRLTDVE